MYDCWTDNAVLWRNVLGFIWDMLNVLMNYNYWIWVQSQRLKSFIWFCTFWESIIFKLLNNDEKKFNKNSTVNLLVV